MFGEIETFQTPYQKKGVRRGNIRGQLTVTIHMNKIHMKKKNSNIPFSLLKKSFVFREQKVHIYLRALELWGERKKRRRKKKKANPGPPSKANLR